ncbi:GDP-mannose-dependent alpha-(1-6)-phosphatidylinositol monomannoside mannosyltransferase [Rubripirellula amarantea]|uniref:GDP-mannose-dependent alpha-(1-6)-phosphatidylinositol monomannoside mannosyltransferase n=1 Tax=Rubripirellula amarantea TaxID=2527999 RepID=A0A5C5WDE7_9BACT|nr:glycosyltransferase [Rubripirellula amarantea]TWT48163.1 GDP-mannose-dependent alpha-(1-6)-phosphatidylinositol monomannoside mannosyltransferase [Rubripirellula amarantea]
MKIALAHHWIMSYRGGERVLEQIAELCPGSDVYVLTHDRTIDVPGVRDRKIHTSLLKHIPRIDQFYKHLLPMHPHAIRRMQVPSDVDLLISSDASLIKGIPLGPQTKHVCYCHSPPRYLWELGSDYKRASRLTSLALDRFSDGLRKFDFESAQNVDHFIANSIFVSDRIRNYYNRDSTVVYPPVDTMAFDATKAREDFDLVLSELAPYKRIDVAVEAYTKLGRRLVVIGDGSERKHLESIAGPTIEFKGRQPFDVVRKHFETCRAFVFPGIEDFGITPVEAQASGAPVVAFRAGGALETVIENETGLFFEQQTADAMIAAIEMLETVSFDPARTRQQAERFSFDEFRRQFLQTLANWGYQLPSYQNLFPSIGMVSGNFHSTVPI